MTARFRRLVETDRQKVALTIDGVGVTALLGDTLMVALLTNGDALRTSEFAELEPSDGRRAGFCLMGACQDCWVWTAQGERLRACSTPVQSGMDISTHQPEATWATVK
jgi:predicted molibdopterin-dependent oxidoreductase YjgC